VLSSGYEIALACGPLKKARYINLAIEKELAEFKEEIAEKFEKSIMNSTFVFPRTAVDMLAPLTSTDAVQQLKGLPQAK